MFISSFPEKYVGKQFEIDCVDIEVHGVDDHCPPLFKGSGVIRGNKEGRFEYKVYNQIPVNEDMFTYLNKLQNSTDPRETNCRLFAKAYDRVEWTGSWSIPNVNIFQSPYLLVEGKLDQLCTRAEKNKGDSTRNATEIVFGDHLDLPYDGTAKQQLLHQDEIVSSSFWRDHHKLEFENTLISFQKSTDKSRLHVTVNSVDNFEPPYVENWIMEALIFANAKIIRPRMVIRHFENDALIFLRATSADNSSGMPPAFDDSPNCREEYWRSFSAYLRKCKSMQQFELLDMTRGFCELCLASKGTLQGFLISLSIFIEFCIKLIFSSIEPAGGSEHKRNVDNLVQYVKNWEGDIEIKKRAEGLLSGLRSPLISQRMDVLIERGIITKHQKKIWKKARPYLAHGQLIDFSKEDEFYEYRNHLISMVYRLMFRIIGYKGLVLDFDGVQFNHVEYNWKG